MYRLDSCNGSGVSAVTWHDTDQVYPIKHAVASKQQLINSAYAMAASIMTCRLLHELGKVPVSLLF